MIRIMTVLLATALAASAWNARAAETLDGWVLSLSWSPQYCKQKAGSKERQCVEENYWVPQGIAPLLASGPAEDCAEVAPLEPEQLDRMLLTVPNRAEIMRRWRREAGCTGLTAEQYAMQLDFAARRVTVPQRYRLVSEDGAESRGAVRKAFLDANPGLPAESLRLECSRRYLEAAHFCMDRNMKFRACPETGDLDCKEEVKIRGIDRARIR